MDKNAVWKWLTLFVLVSFSLWRVLPLKKNVRLGLDLKGGTSFVVKIDEERIAEDIKARFKDMTDEQVLNEVKTTLSGAQARALEVLRNRVDNLGIAEPIIYPGKDNRIVIQLPGIDDAKREEAERSINSVAFLEFRMVHEDDEELVDKMLAKGLAPEGYRITTMGDTQFYKRDPSFPESRMDKAYKIQLGRFNVPDAGYEFMLEKEERDNQTVFRPVFVKRRREMSGEYLKNAAVDYRALGQPVVLIQFDARGAKMFGGITADYAPGGARNPNPNETRRLAIVLDGTLYSAPVLREAIYGGRAEISGNFTIVEAKLLSNILRAGSLPAPVKIVEKRFVAPSLGADSIRSGVRATIYGSILVVVFMMAYYSLAGVIADLALLLNIVLLPLGMIASAGFLGIFAGESSGGGAIQLPVLTLPGIAGIALTIGMAVDANVLIFERIREELRLGKRFWGAITAGYDRAFTAIADSNITTLLTAIILFILGSGPLRGFAVTLSAGIIMSMFTAIVVTKLMFGLIASRTRIQTLKMSTIIPVTSIDFIKFKNPAVLFSIAVIVVSWGIMVLRGAGNTGNIFGVDFTGGVSVMFDFEKKQPAENIRKALAGAGIREAHVQYQKELNADADTALLIKTGDDPIGGEKPAEIVKKTLANEFPDSKFTPAQEEEVGAQIGAELKKRSLWAIIFSLVGIIVYLAWRFEMGFALGAIVALAHDVLVTVGVYSLCGRQISLTIVAALLTIVGFSVNDTIVIFDRIRENLRLVRDKNFKDICNISINQTLSRTLLTSFTALITVVMLLFFGGGAINDFALALFIGMLAGVYSTVYIATPVVLLWHRGKRPDFAVKT